jgi:hypothetical protein
LRACVIRQDWQGMSGKVIHTHSQAFQTYASIMRAIQTYASIASDVQSQVSCNRGGGGRARVVAITSIGSTSHLKNVQMAKVLDGVCVGGNTGHD